MRTIFLIIFLFNIFNLNAQDVSLSQFYSNPIYLNPAFAGSAAVPRIALQYRNQFHSFSNAYSTYSAAFDLPVKKLGGGLGLLIMNDSQAGNSFRSLQLDLAYSVMVRISESYFLLGAVQGGYHEHSLDISKLVFPDNVDINYGNHGISREVEFLSWPRFSYADFSSGVVLYSNRYYAGLALHHLAEPQQSFYSSEGNESKLYRKYTAHLGARLPVFLYGHQRKKFDISPQLVMQYQGSFGQINYGLFATKWGFTAGTWFRQNFGIRYDAVIFHVGFLKRNWQLTYTYDIAVSGLWGDSGGSSEISLVFLFREADKGRYLPFYNFYEDEFGVQ
jgi:type IX secretion system PorP/SprF family membrane protein